MTVRSTVPSIFFLAVFAAPAPAQGYPTTPPPAAPVSPAAFPPFQEFTLGNGLRVILVESHRQPVVSLSLAMPAGDAFDPPGKEGLATMVSGLLTKGAGARAADAIAATIEGVGGSLSASSGPDWMEVEAQVLAPDASLAFELMADAVRRPTFPERELDLLRTQSLSALQLERSQPAAIASRHFARLLYGEHPYGRRATQASVRGITREDLIRFHEARLRPAGSLLVIAGAITPADARRLAESALGGWTGSPAASAPFPAPGAAGPTRILLVHRPGSVQSNVVAGNLTFRPGHPQAYAATMANHVLGGGADARLFLILREEKGWTYGAYSSLTTPKETGSWQAGTEVRTEATDSALARLLEELRRIRTTPVSEEELTAAKGALVGRFPLTIETADQIAGAVTRARLLGLPEDYLSTYRTKLAAVSAADLMAAARTAISPESLGIVVVGDATRLADALRRLAPVTVVDVDGAPLDLDALAAPPRAVALDLSRMVARSDSFSIVFQGAPLGWQRTALEPTDSGYLYRESLRLATLIETDTDLTIDAGGRVRRVRVSGRVQGQAAATDLAYDAGHVTGHATSPTPTGPLQVTVDTMVQADAMDDSALQAFVPALAWAPGARWTFPVFSPSQGTVTPWTLEVTGTEEVTVPAGTFQAYRAELTGGNVAFIWWVSVDGPYRLLKVAFAGQPVEVVRVR